MRINGIRKLLGEIRAKLNALTEHPNINRVQNEFKHKSVKRIQIIQSNISSQSHKMKHSKNVIQNNVESIFKKLQTSKTWQLMKPPPIHCTSHNEYGNSRTKVFKLKTTMIALCVGYGLTLGFIALVNNAKPNSDAQSQSVYSFWSNLSYRQQLFGIGCGVATVVAFPSVLSIIGFSSAGVVKGSLAALIHSKIGCVAAGSLFGLAQSSGATAQIGAATKVAVTIAGGVIGSIGMGKPENNKTTDNLMKHNEAFTNHVVVQWNALTKWYSGSNGDK